MKVTLRIPDELGERLKELAKEAKRSLNSEIEYRLERSVKESGGKSLEEEA